jgi:competence protein ComEA
VASRLARLALLLAALAPSGLRSLAGRPSPPRACAPEGRGVPPRHWIGCAADPGPPRALVGEELLLVGLPVPLNAASAADLAAVPGLGSRLAGEVVADRERRGPFRTVDDLLRVKGVGPARLAQARPHLTAP